MPTAVRIESIENTRSRIRICTIAAPKFNRRAWRPARPRSCGRGRDPSCGGFRVVAFQTRNRPPAIRMMSRQENSVSQGRLPCSPGRRSGRGSPPDPPARRSTRSKPSRARRMISARLMPILRALARVDGSGSLLVRIEMKIRLSMPRTISITTRKSAPPTPKGRSVSGSSVKSMCR